MKVSITAAVALATLVCTPALAESVSASEEKPAFAAGLSDGGFTESATAAASEEASSSHALSEPNTEPFFAITGSVTFASDFVPRGFSVNNENPVIQGGIDARHVLTPSLNLHIGALGSSVADDAAQGATEFDPYIGLSGPLNKNTSWSLTYWRIVYPNSKIPLDFNEFTATVTHTRGDLSLGLLYLHDEFRDGGVSDWVNLTPAWRIPNSNFTLKGGLGYEDGSTWDGKVNWDVGVFYTYANRLTFGARYMDTNKTDNPALGYGDIAAARTVFSVSAAF